MAIKLQIRKFGTDNFNHILVGLGNFKLSQFYCKADGDYFKITELSGSNRTLLNPQGVGIKYDEIAFYDDTNGGSEEVFGSMQALFLRLKAVAYTGFKSPPVGGGIPEAPEDDNIYGRKNAGWVIVTGGGSGYTPVNLKNQYAGAVTVPTGFVLTRILSLNDIYKDVTGIVAGTTLTVTGADTDEILLIDGYKP